MGHCRHARILIIVTRKVPGIHAAVQFSAFHRGRPRFMEHPRRSGEHCGETLKWNRERKPWILLPAARRGHRVPQREHFTREKGSYRFNSPGKLAWGKPVGALRRFWRLPLFDPVSGGGCERKIPVFSTPVTGDRGGKFAPCVFGVSSPRGNAELKDEASDLFSVIYHLGGGTASLE